jgi:hypothetical protein
MKLNHWIVRILTITATLSFAAYAPAGSKKTDLSGRWMMVQVTGTVASVPIVGAIRSTTRTVMLFDIEERHDRLRGSGKLCSIDIDSGSSFVDTWLPRAFVRSLPTPKLDARLYRKNGKVTLYQPPQVIVVGAKLKDIVRDRLPASSDDRRVFDQDRDGKPGVTVKISGLVSGEVYVAQRNWVELRGRQRNTGEFAGRVRFGNEQVLLGASNSMLESPPNARPEPNRSYFHMLRVADGFACKAARRVAKRFVR